jgi:phospholipid transport system transporter-binding protein
MTLPADFRANHASAGLRAGLAQVAGGAGEIDLSGITRCDSSLVAAALAWQSAAKAQGRTLKFSNAPQGFGKLAALYGVEGLVTPDVMPAVVNAVGSPSSPLQGHSHH